MESAGTTSTGWPGLSAASSALGTFTLTTSRSRSTTSASTVVRSAASPALTFTLVTTPARGDWTCSRACWARAAASCLLGVLQRLLRGALHLDQLLLPFKGLLGKAHRHVRRAAVELEQQRPFLHALAFDAVDRGHHARHAGRHAGAGLRFRLDGAIRGHVAPQRARVIRGDMHRHLRFGFLFSSPGFDGPEPDQPRQAGGGRNDWNNYEDSLHASWWECPQSSMVKPLPGEGTSRPLERAAVNRR